MVFVANHDLKHYAKKRRLGEAVVANPPQVTSPAARQGKSSPNMIVIGPTLILRQHHSQHCGGGGFGQSDQ